MSVTLAVIGFLAPFIPEAIKFVTQGRDLRHEKEMTELRMKAGAQESTWRIAEANARADADVEVAIRQPQQSFGIQLLDKAAALGWHPAWLMPMFYLFGLMDFLSGMVRSTITYLTLGAYLFYKYCLYELLTSERFANSMASAGVQLWTPNDWELLFMVFAYWLGDRTRKAAFGGAARSN